MTRPEPGLVLGSCTITRVVDGDTVEVEVRRRVRVRIADCWSPETRKTKHPTEKGRGLAAQEVAEQFFPVGSQVVLQIASDGDLDWGDQVTFGRCLGDVWHANRPPYTNSFSELMNLTGHTFPTKADLEASLVQSDHELAKANYEAL